MLSFLIAFLFFICVVAIVIIGCRWLMREAALPPELKVILQIILFLVLLCAFVYWVPMPPGVAPWHR